MDKKLLSEMIMMLAGCWSHSVIKRRFAPPWFARWQIIFRADKKSKQKPQQTNRKFTQANVVKVACFQIS